MALQVCLRVRSEPAAGSRPVPTKRGLQTRVRLLDSISITRPAVDDMPPVSARAALAQPSPPPWLLPPAPALLVVGRPAQHITARGVGAQAPAPPPKKFGGLVPHRDGRAHP
mgnify:CR=1 FL=1